MTAAAIQVEWRGTGIDFARTFMKRIYYNAFRIRTPITSTVVLSLTAGVPVMCAVSTVTLCWTSVGTDCMHESCRTVASRRWPNLSSSAKLSSPIFSVTLLKENMTLTHLIPRRIIEHTKRNTIEQ